MPTNKMRVMKLARLRLMWLVLSMYQPLHTYIVLTTGKLHRGARPFCFWPFMRRGLHFWVYASKNNEKSHLVDFLCVRACGLFLIWNLQPPSSSLCLPSIFRSIHLSSIDQPTTSIFHLSYWHLALRCISGEYSPSFPIFPANSFAPSHHPSWV